MQVVIPKGVTYSSTVKVSLPYTIGKLQAIYGQVVAMPSSISCALSQGDMGTVRDDALGDGIADSITFSLGDITNNPGVTSNNTITLVVVIVVSKDPLTTNNDVLTTTAALSYNNGSQALSLSDSFAVKVVEPSLTMTNVPVTTYTSHIGSGTVVRFTLTLSNVPVTSTGPSYNIDIYDGLSSEFVLNVGSVTSSGGGIRSGNTPGDTVVHVNPSPLLPTETLTVTFNATLQDIVEPNVGIINTATFNYSSAPLQTYNYNNLRNQTGTKQSTVTPTTPVVKFQLNYTTITDTKDPYVAIGESASIVTTISIPKVLPSPPLFHFI